MILTDKTSIDDLKAAGADTLGDIPLVDLIAYVRNACLSVAKDITKHGTADFPEGWDPGFTSAVLSLDETAESLEKMLGAPQW